MQSLIVLFLLTYISLNYTIICLSLCEMIMSELSNDACHLLQNEAFSFLIEVVSDNLYNQVGKSHLAEIMGYIKDNEAVEKPYLISFLKSIKNTKSFLNLPHLNTWIQQTIQNIH